MLPQLIETAELRQHLNDKGLMIIDLCRDEIYRQQHIPGAIHVNPQELVSGVKPATGKLPPITRLNSLFSRIGYAKNKHIVAYDDEGGGWAGRFIWTLDVIGHGHSSLLNGGLLAWVADQLPVTSEIPDVQATQVSVTVNRDVIAEKEDVLKGIETTGTVIWDARSPEEFTGTKIFAARGGHIPGAINLDWLELMDRNNQLRLRSDIRNLIEDRGIRSANSVITHCQTHHRSGLTYLVGKLLGLNIKAYHGSWSEWGNDPDTPIENPALSTKNS